MPFPRLLATGLSSLFLASLGAAASTSDWACAKTDHAPASPSISSQGNRAATAPTVSLSTARQKAAHEGKVLLVDFWASYCLPCRMMDETTFADPQVLDYLREHYVSIKIDVQNFDGLAIHQQYGVGELPTMIVFSSTGEEVDRIEGAISAADMLVRLRQNDRPANRIARPDVEPVADWTEPFAKMSNAYAETEAAPAKTATLAQASPAKKAPAEAAPARGKVLAQASTTLPLETAPAATDPTEYGTQTQPNERILATAPSPEAALAMGSAPAERATEHNVNEPTASAPTAAAQANVVPAPQRSTPSPQPTPETFPIHARITYSLQVGAFAELDNADRTAEALEDATDAEVAIEADAEGGRIVYRVLAGAFATRTEAEALREALAPSGFEAFAMAR